MRNAGFFILAVGIIWLLVSLNMDTSIATGYGGRVNNIGLMASKQNYIIIGGLITICGLLISIFCKSSPSYNMVKCPLCAEVINRDAVKCKHCGSDISEFTTKVKMPKISGLNTEDIVINNANGEKELNGGAISVMAMALHKEMPKNTALSVMVTNSPTISMIKENMDKKMGREFELTLEEEIKKIKSSI